MPGGETLADLLRYINTQPLFWYNFVEDKKEGVLGVRFKLQRIRITGYGPGAELFRYVDMNETQAPWGERDKRTNKKTCTSS